ncbi:MAG: S41 family peptidase [Akkermansiaceae bacterium]|nr:S41 family peptidase [Akkermansiaceae bacterium]
MRRLLPLLLGPSLCLGQEPALLPDDGQGYQHVERFIQILEKVRENHPDPDSVSYERLVNHALEGMLGSLDKFSAFYHPETYAYISEEKGQPEIPGLGLTLTKSDKFLSVAAVRTGSPASRAKIVPGDRILKIREEEVGELSLRDALLKMGGQPGEAVKLTLRHKGDHRDNEVTLLRTVVKQEAITDALILERSSEKKVGYIHLAEFTAPSHRELEAALDDLEDKGMKSLIFDLRGNPGGLLNISVEILGEFLPPSTEVVFTRGRNPAHSSDPLKTPDRQRKKRDYPIAVLIDNGSASASELVSGALQDLKRATIVGETSYGKGSVQQIMPMGNGTALRLTIAKYHTPSGSTPHEVGITPDVAIEISQDDRDLLNLWRRRDSLTPEEAGKLGTWKDPVLSAALAELAK